MNEQQRGEYDALVTRQKTYKKLVEASVKSLNRAVEAYVNNTTVFTELDKSMLETLLDGYQTDLFLVNTELETFLKNL